MRPKLHFTAARGWINDPNGLIERDGVHHLFFQHNPHGTTMHQMCWGHATSTDLLTWTEHPLALEPGPPGSYDDEGCWSGCAVADDAGVAVIYSGNHGGIQLPCVARARDDELISWARSPANPVVATRPPLEAMTDMRDHSVRRDAGRWRQVLAAGVAGEGMLLGYSSDDLIGWDWDGIVLRGSEAGIPGRVWECPDVFETAGGAVAIFSVDARPSVLWATGTLDGPRFVPVRWGPVDYGTRFYAPQSYGDGAGRRIMFGWLTTHADPAMRDQSFVGAISLPRVLSVVDGRLHQRPAAELEQRRGHPQHARIDAGDRGRPVPLGDHRALEVRLVGQPDLDLAHTRVELGDGAGRSMTVDLGMFAAPAGPPAPDPDPAAARAHEATIYFDAGIVEVFLDDGRAAALSDVRLQEPSTLRIEGAGPPVEVTVWDLGGPAESPTG